MPVHIAILYAGILGLLLMALSFNVMHHWVRVTASGQETDQAMRRAERVVGNFVEQVPFALILFILLEIAGAPPGILHALDSTLVVARLCHAFGSNDMRGANILRFVGAQLSFLVLTIASIACIYLFVFSRL
jgi:uncharacterized membrane protein YecN with MAPEG domain